MIELTLGAQQRLDSYIEELRRVLGDDGKADPRDVERDVRDHIQTALASTSGPVDEPQLDQVLRSLGAPAEWVEHPDLPWYARSPKAWLHPAKEYASEKIHHFAAGPESYRMPYLSLLTLGLGLILGLLSGDDETGLAICLVAALGAFVLARAAIAIQPKESLPNGQKWLLSPALLTVYLPLLIVIVSWPVVVGGILVAQSPLTKLTQAELNRIRLLEQKASGITLLDSQGHPVVQDYDSRIVLSNALIHELKKEQQDLLSELGYPLILVLLWWFVLGVLSLSMPNTVRTIFAPFSPRAVRRSMVGIAALSTLVSGVILGMMAAIRS